MVDVARVSDLVEPLVTASGCSLYDVTWAGKTLRVAVDAEGGVDMTVLHDLTRQISILLDDVDPVAGTYTLEVSSPGLERKLRRPDHFAGAVGSDISVKLRGPEGTERVRAKLAAAGDDDITLLTDDGTERTVPFDAVLSATTIFDWGPTPKRGGAKGKGKQAKADPKGASR